MIPSETSSDVATNLVLNPLGFRVGSSRAMSVLGVHGFKRTNLVIDFLWSMQTGFREKGIAMEAPHFQSGDIADYATWQKVFQGHFRENVDTVVTHSMWARAVIEYILECQKKIKRLVMVAPSATSTSTSVSNFYDQLSHKISDISGLVDERVVISSMDDAGREWKATEFAEQTDAVHIEFSGWYRHFNIVECPFIDDIVLNGVERI